MGTKLGETVVLGVGLSTLLVQVAKVSRGKGITAARGNSAVIPKRMGHPTVWVAVVVLVPQVTPIMRAKPSRFVVLYACAFD